MEHIFDIVSGEIVLSAEGLAIPFFKKIWDKDKSEDKKQALNNIKYVIFLVDILKSPYRYVDELVKETTLKTDIFGDPSYELDEDTQEAVKRFSEIKLTTTLKLLRSAKMAVEQLANYFSVINFNEKDSYGKPVYQVNDVAANLGRVGTIVKSLNTLEEAAKRESHEGDRVKGGTEIEYFEDPDNY